MSPTLKLYCQDMLWYDQAENGNYFAVVLAPDDETAKRLIAAEMLEHGDDNLYEMFVVGQRDDDKEPATLERYYRKHGELGAWSDIGGTACPNCTSHCGQKTDDGETIAGVNVHQCNSCGYRWVPLGFGEKRAELETIALANIGYLDELERKSASPDGDECGQCDGTGTTQSASNGEDEECPVCDGSGEAS